MKKITLVLCACAMAFAGLLVSCSNDAGSGDVNLIYRDSTTYEYVYQLSGTMEVKTETATDKRQVLTTNTLTNSFEGLAEISWSENDDKIFDYKNYTLKVLGAKNFTSVEKETYSGSNASTMGTFNTKTTMNVTDFVGDVTLGAKLEAIPDVDFYEFAEAFYYGTASAGNTAFTNSLDIEAVCEGTDDGTGDPKVLPVKVSVTGDIAEDDDITIVVTYVDDDLDNDGDDSDANSVDAQTITWTYKLSKATSSEE